MNVLLVSDDNRLAHLLSTQLSAAEHNVRITSQESETLQLIQTGVVPDLVIIALGLNSLGLCRQIRQHYSLLELPILLLGNLSPDEVPQGFDAGANGYLPMSSLPTEFMARVTMLLKLKSLYSSPSAEETRPVGNANLEQQIQVKHRELSALYEVSAVTSQFVKLEEMLTQALDRTLAALNSHIGLIHILEAPLDDEEGAAMRLAVHRGLAPQIQAKLDPMPIDRGLGARIIQQRTPVYVPRLTDPSADSEAQDLTALFAPLRADGQVKGIFGLLRDAQQSFTADEVSLVSTVADQIGLVVESGRLRRVAEQTAILEERQRLARDLHDSVTQSLYGLIVTTEIIELQLEQADYSSVSQQVDRIADMARQSLKEMRLFIHQLRPPILEEEGLIAALHQRLAAVEGRADINTRLVSDNIERLPDAIEEAFYHITQEGLNNTLRHAAAQQVTIRLSRTETTVTLEITDNGRGFDRDVIERGGSGLTNMQTRAEQLGAAFDLSSTPGVGTRVTVTARLDQP
ncbi:MAG: histidine kinase [Chloroflexota bacterium]